MNQAVVFNSLRAGSRGAQFHDGYRTPNAFVAMAIDPPCERTRCRVRIVISFRLNGTTSLREVHRRMISREHGSGCPPRDRLRSANTRSTRAPSQWQQHRCRQSRALRVVCRRPCNSFRTNQVRRERCVALPKLHNDVVPAAPEAVWASRNVPVPLRANLTDVINNLGPEGFGGVLDGGPSTRWPRTPLATPWTYSHACTPAALTMSASAYCLPAPVSKRQRFSGIIARSEHTRARNEHQGPTSARLSKSTTRRMSE